MVQQQWHVLFRMLIPVSLAICFVLAAGCASVRATGGAEAKDLSVLDQGRTRYEVIAEFGAPVLSEQTEDGSKIDVFAFKQGHTTGARATRSLLYGSAAVVTLGLSEIVANPVEGVVGEGADLQVKVEYDENNLVDAVTILRDERWIPLQEINDAPEN